MNLCTSRNATNVCASKDSEIYATLGMLRNLCESGDATWGCYVTYVNLGCYEIYVNLGKLQNVCKSRNATKCM